MSFFTLRLIAGSHCLSKTMWKKKLLSPESVREEDKEKETWDMRWDRQNTVKTRAPRPCGALSLCWPRVGCIVGGGARLVLVVISTPAP